MMPTKSRKYLIVATDTTVSTITVAYIGARTYHDISRRQVERTRTCRGRLGVGVQALGVPFARSVRCSHLMDCCYTCDDT